jgi:hypothetical protein
MSVTNFLIPLTNTPQKFTISLAGTNYVLVSKWNDSTEAGWILDIYDANENPIVMNVPLITGEDCLTGLGYLGIQGSLFVMTNGASPFDVPTLDNLGTESNLYFQTSVPNG